MEAIIAAIVTGIFGIIAALLTWHLTLKSAKSRLQENKQECGISQYDKGINDLSDIEWDYSSPLKILHTQIPNNGLKPDMSTLKKFIANSTIEIIFAHSEKVAQARSAALNRPDYHENGMSKTVEFLYGIIRI